MCWCDFGRGGGLEEWGSPKLASTAPRSNESPNPHFTKAGFLVIMKIAIKPKEKRYASI